MTSKPVRFSKYDQMGAYHWAECDRSSRAYNPPLEARYRVLLKRLERTNRVLDLGCGDGYLMSLASPVSGAVIGIDSEFTAVALARPKLEPFANCALLQASCYSLPFANGYFDAVLLADVIEHLDHPSACLKETVRVLKPSGLLLATTPKWRPDRKWDQRHVREYEPGELLGSLQDYFAEVRLSYFWPIPWYRVHSTKLGWRLTRIFARHFFNPFVKEGADPEDYYQILAVCRKAGETGGVKLVPRT